MAATLTAKINLTLDALAANTVGLALVQGVVSKASPFVIPSGIGANQADRIYSAAATSIAASGTLDLDLSGVLLDVFGVALVFARVKAIYVTADPTNVNNVVLGAAAATQFLGPFGGATFTAHVRPGGAALFVAPDATAWPVVNAASDLFRIANGGAGTPVLFDIVIIGASA